jgi:hypothetical protein
MYKKDIQFSVIEIIDIDSSCIIGAELKRHKRKSLFIFGVYMYLPSDINIQSYVDEINLLEALYNHYSEYGDVLTMPVLKLKTILVATCTNQKF